ncbi:MAG: site-specific integrase [Chloroflexota bacterium]|nr:site-specific integrase [Chloroflexota bacterium]
MPHVSASLLDSRGRKYLTAQERERFLAAAREHPTPGVQTFALTLAHTGCRISEALALRAGDVDLATAEIRIATLKRRREHWRAVPVPAALVRELALVHSLRRAQATPKRAALRLWPFSRSTGTRHVHALMRQARIEGPQASPKGLRHAFGVAAVTAGVPLPTIAAVLGHAELTTTAVYTTAIGAEARELIARMWPAPATLPPSAGGE